jgi:hypothetical protein
MSGLLKHFEFMSSTAAEGLGLVVADSAQNAALLRQAENEPNKLVEFPKRPDLTALSETIPLFYECADHESRTAPPEGLGRSVRPG